MRKMNGVPETKDETAAYPKKECEEEVVPDLVHSDSLSDSESEEPSENAVNAWSGCTSM